MYTIKTYEEGFIDKQVEIGKKVTDPWIGYTMQSADAIRNSYSQEGFDPETRLYAFKGDEMVGFLTGYVYENDQGEKHANYRLPILLPEHQDAAKQLIEKSFEILRSKGASRITTTLREDWGAFESYAQTYGFKFDQEGNRFALLEVENLKVPNTNNSDEKIEELDLEKHEDALIKIFENAFGMEHQAAKNNFDLIKSFDQNLIVTHSAIFKNNEIVGRVLLYRGSPNTTEAYMGNIFAIEDRESEIFDLMIAHIATKAKAVGIKTINKPGLGQESKSALYEKYGFDFKYSIKTYTYDLN